MTRPVVQKSLFLKLLPQRSPNWDSGLRIFSDGGDSFEDLSYVKLTGQNCKAKRQRLPREAPQASYRRRRGSQEFFTQRFEFVLLIERDQKACKMESDIKPRNVKDVDGSGELLTRLIKYPAETRSDNKIKAAARASWRHGW